VASLPNTLAGALWITPPDQTSRRMTLRPPRAAVVLLHARRSGGRNRHEAREGKAMHLVTAENGLQLVAAIVLAGIILFELRAAVIALNNAERYYTAFTLVLASAVVCLAVLSR
jgi:hypothetical protein